MTSTNSYEETQKAKDHLRDLSQLKLDIELYEQAKQRQANPETLEFLKKRFDLSKPKVPVLENLIERNKREYDVQKKTYQRVKTDAPRESFKRISEIIASSDNRAKNNSELVFIGESKQNGITLYVPYFDSESQFEQNLYSLITNAAHPANCTITQQAYDSYRQIDITNTDPKQKFLFRTHNITESPLLKSLGLRPKVYVLQDLAWKEPIFINSYI